MANAGPGQNQEPRTPSEFPTWVAGAHALKPSFITFPGIVAENWFPSGAAET